MTSEEGDPRTASDNESSADTSTTSDAKQPIYISISSGQDEDDDSDDAEHRKKKRKRVDEDSEKVPSSKRMRGHYRDEYRLIYNKTVEDARERFEGAEFAESLSTSQIGLSMWTANEKALLFNALAKLGRDAIKEIAVAIGSKSEVQVREFILLLRDGLVEHVLNDRHYSLMSFAEMPAAVELSQQCCENLEAAAQALAKFQDNHDARTEQKKHGDNWLLTSEIANEIEESLSSLGEEQQSPSRSDLPADRETDERSNMAVLDRRDNHGKVSEDFQSITNKIPAAKLLNLSNFLLLSETVFMNSGRNKCEDNWRSIAENGENPSIYFTAFEDFYRLTVSITKRLVLASIHQASSRLRAGDWRTSRAPQPNVKPWDVDAAVEILNMKKNGREFWAKTARRCRINVFDGYSDERPLSYDHVEAELGYRAQHPQLPRDVGHLNDPKPIAVDSHSDHDMQASDMESTHSNESEVSDLSSDSLQGFHLKTSELRRRQLEIDEEEDAERIDELVSHHAEAKLWKLMKQRPLQPDAEAANSDSEAPKKNPTRRKHVDQLKDWRDWTHYHPPWMERQANKEPKEVAFETGPSDMNFHNLRGIPFDQPATSRQGLSIRRPSRHVSKAVGTEHDMNESGDESSGEGGSDGDDEGTQHPRVLAPRTARTVAASQLQGIEYVQEPEQSDDEFDPNT
jgi:RNA polymerase I-specific transcription initiation factor RRN5